MPPHTLACMFHRLPPILHSLSRTSLTSYSKGSQGLSVWLRVWGIFTPMSISPSPWSRQRGSRYAIRAGRNLPDKEFRYLRTVIVTAAVYLGFNSELSPLLLTFRHRAGVRPYTSSCDFAEPCVFSKQSPPPGLCPRHSCAGPPSRELTEVFCRVPSTSFSQAPWYALPVHLCWFRVRSHGGLFPGTNQRPTQSDKGEQPS